MTLLLAVLLMARSQQSIAAKQAPYSKITSISVRGAVRLPADRVIDIAGLKIGQRISEPALRLAKSRLRKSGWFGGSEPDFPERTVRVTADETKGRVTIEVDENPIVRAIVIDDAGPLEEKDLLKLVGSKVGKMLNVNVARDDASEIQRAYSREGYKAYCAGGYRIRDGVLTFPMEVARIRSIRIEGLPPETTERARKAMKAKPGDYFNVNTLQEDYTRLYNLGLFRDLAPAILERGMGIEIFLRATP